MKKITLTIILTANIIIGVLGQNLISNSSFETSGQLNCQSWYDGCGQELTYFCDTITPDSVCDAWFAQDAPAGGGNWSIELRATMLVEGLAETYITGQSDTNIYQLEYWMKSPGWTGTASIGITSQNQFTASKTISDTTSIWKKYTLIDTIPTQATDTIAIRLSAGTGDFCICTSYFDLVELTILDTLTSIENINRFENDDIKVYPNPYKDFTNIEFTLKETSSVSLEVYNILGAKINTIENSKKQPGHYNYKFSAKDLGYPAGLYLIKINIDHNSYSIRILEF